MDLKAAIETGDLTMITFCLEIEGQQLPSPAESHNLLKLALSKNNIKYYGFYIYKLLLEHDAPITGYDEPGQNTLLHIAAERGNPDMVVGLEVELEEIVEHMLHNDLSVTAVNKKNETPIHVAAKNESGKILNMFVDKLMERPEKLCNIVDQEGLSLFHIICSCKNPDYVTTFLNHVPAISINHAVSADSTWCTGYSAMDFATVCNRHKTVEILKEHGADADAEVRKD